MNPKLSRKTVFCLFLTAALLFAATQLGTAESNRLTVFEATGYEITAGRIMFESGIGASRYLASQVFLLPYATPWDIDMRYGTGHSEHIRPNDPIVQAVAQTVFLRPGKGIYYRNNIDLRLEIDPRSDVEFWGKAYYQPPGYTLYTGKGDCDCRAIAICSLLRAMGYRAMVVRGYNNASGQMHMWVEYKIGAAVYCADFNYDSIQTSGRVYCHNFSGDIKCFPKEEMFCDTRDWGPYSQDW